MKILKYLFSVFVVVSTFGMEERGGSDSENSYFDKGVFYEDKNDCTILESLSNRTRYCFTEDLNRQYYSYAEIIKIVSKFTLTIRRINDLKDGFLSSNAIKQSSSRYLDGVLAVYRDLPDALKKSQEQEKLSETELLAMALPLKKMLYEALKYFEKNSALNEAINNAWEEDYKECAKFLLPKTLFFLAKMEIVPEKQMVYCIKALIPTYKSDYNTSENQQHELSEDQQHELMDELIKHDALPHLLEIIAHKPKNVIDYWQNKYSDSYSLTLEKFDHIQYHISIFSKLLSEDFRLLEYQKYIINNGDNSKNNLIRRAIQDFMHSADIIKKTEGRKITEKDKMEFMESILSMYLDLVKEETPQREIAKALRENLDEVFDYADSVSSALQLINKIWGDKYNYFVELLVGEEVNNPLFWSDRGLIYNNNLLCVRDHSGIKNFYTKTSDDNGYDTLELVIKALLEDIAKVQKLSGWMGKIPIVEESIKTYVKTVMSVYSDTLKRISENKQNTNYLSTVQPILKMLPMVFALLSAESWNEIIDEIWQGIDYATILPADILLQLARLEFCPMKQSLYCKTALLNKNIHPKVLPNENQIELFELFMKLNKNYEAFFDFTKQKDKLGILKEYWEITYPLHFLKTELSYQKYYLEQYQKLNRDLFFTQITQNKQLQTSVKELEEKNSALNGEKIILTLQKDDSDQRLIKVINERNDACNKLNAVQTIYDQQEAELFLLKKNDKNAERKAKRFEEEKTALQKQIEELNKVIAAQNKEVEALKKGAKTLDNTNNQLKKANELLRQEVDDKKINLLEKQLLELKKNDTCNQEKIRAFNLKLNQLNAEKDKIKNDYCQAKEKIELLSNDLKNTEERLLELLNKNKEELIVREVEESKQRSEFQDLRQTNHKLQKELEELRNKHTEQQAVEQPISINLNDHTKQITCLIETLNAANKNLEGANKRMYEQEEIMQELKSRNQLLEENVQQMNESIKFDPKAFQANILKQNLVTQELYNLRKENSRLKKHNNLLQGEQISIDGIILQLQAYKAQNNQYL